jgi:hypothetical protein
MNCTSFRELVHDLDRLDGADAAACDGAIAHAQVCTRCARELYRVRELGTALHRLAEEDERLRPSPAVEVNVIRAFRAQVPVPLWRSRAAWWMGAAAAVVLAAGVGMHRRRPTSVSRSQPAAMVASGRSLTGAPSAPATAKALLSPKPPTGTRVDRGAKEKAPSRELAGFDELADFVPLPFAQDESPIGEGEVVRIRLSESALGLLGVPVGASTANEPVTADVVIGEDGVARAIRFVSGPVPPEIEQSIESASLASKGVNQ